MCNHVCISCDYNLKQEYLSRKYLESLTLFLRLYALSQLKTLTFHSPKTLV